MIVKSNERKFVTYTLHLRIWLNSVYNTNIKRSDYLREFTK